MKAAAMLSPSVRGQPDDPRSSLARNWATLGALSSQRPRVRRTIGLADSPWAVMIGAQVARSPHMESSKMTKVTVYQVQLYDGAKDESIVSRRMATPGGAATMGGAIIKGTGYVIDATEL